MESSQTRYAIEFIYFCGITLDDATVNVATHSSRLQPSIISNDPVTTLGIISRNTQIHDGTNGTMMCGNTEVNKLICRYATKNHP